METEDLKKLSDSTLDALLSLYETSLPDKRAEFSTAKDNYDRARFHYEELKAEKQRRMEGAK